MALQLLKKLGHQHGILASGDAYGHPVPGLQQAVGTDGFREGRHQVLPKPPHPPQGFLNFLLPAFPGQVFPQPRAISILQAYRVIALLLQLLGQGQALGSVHAEQDKLPVPRKLPVFRPDRQIRNMQRSRNRPVGIGSFISYINQNPGLLRNIRQLLQGYFQVFHALSLLSAGFQCVFSFRTLTSARCWWLLPHTALYTGDSSIPSPSGAPYAFPVPRSFRR